MLQFIKQNRKKIIYSVIAFLLPLMALWTAFYFPGVTDHKFTILTSDLNGQYVDYFSYFRNAVVNWEGLLYSFSVSLGSDTFSMLGYYMFSPFNLIVFLFPADCISEAIGVIIFLKISLAGSTCYLFLDRNSQPRLSTIIFAVSYALSGYIFTFFMNLMWLDAVYMLPLVIWGVDRIFRRGELSFYCISLTLSMLFCYYTGYMLAGFSVLFVIYLLLAGDYPYGNGRHGLLRYIGGSALAAGMSAAFLLPTLLSQFSKSRVKAESQVADWSILSKFFTGATTLDDFECGLPQIYCGMFILIFFLVFLFSGSVKLREKIGALFLAGSVFASFCITPLNMVWHGFSSPNDFQFRYSFVLTFVMVFFAHAIFQKQRVTDIKWCVLATLSVFALALVVLFMKFPLVRIEFLAFDMVIALAMCLAFAYMVKSDVIDRGVFCLIVAILQLFQLIVNATTFTMVHPYDDYSHDGYYRELSPFVERVSPGKDEFYRIEKTFSNSFNDAMTFHFPSITHFSSTWSTDLNMFLDDLGYSGDRKIWVNYAYGATPALDSFLGIKYFLTKGEKYENYAQVFKTRDFAISENSYALAIGMICDEKACIPFQNERAMDPFMGQQELYQRISGEDVILFHPCEYRMELDHMAQNGEFFTRTEENQGSIRIIFTAQDAFPVYMHMAAEWYPGMNYSVNGKYVGDCLTKINHGVIPLGCFTPGETVEVDFVLQEGYTQFSKPYLYSLDMSELGRISNKLQQKGWKIEAFENDEILARISVKEENAYLFTTIPFDTGWKVQVDGVEVETNQALTHFLAFPVSEGEHTIHMKYHARGLMPGIFISIGAWCVAILLIIMERKNRERTRTRIEERAAAKPVKNKEQKKCNQHSAEIVPERGIPETHEPGKAVSEQDTLKQDIVKEDELERENLEYDVPKRSVSESVKPGKEAVITSRKVKKAEKKQMHEEQLTFVCQLCQNEKNYTKLRMVNMFSTEISKETSERYVDWNRMCLCRECVELHQNQRAVLPYFWSQVEETQIDPEQSYTFLIQFFAGDSVEGMEEKWENGMLTFDGKHLKEVQRAYELEKWMNESLDEFFCYSPETGGMNFQLHP